MTKFQPSIYKIQFPSGFPQCHQTGAYNDIGLPIWMLDVPYEIIVDNCRLIIKKGFHSDFCSIRPRFVRAWLNPCDPLTGPPGWLHDLLCSCAILPWKVNADIFYSAMTYMGVNGIRREVMYRAVRCAGLLPTYADVDEIFGYRKECGIESTDIPLESTVVGLGMMAKQRKLDWLIPV